MKDDNRLIQPRNRLRRWLKRMAGGLLATVMTIGGYLGYLQLSGNFHPVIAGEVYRSAQPSGDAIARYAREQGIRSIINLRGPNPGKAWYDEEIEAATTQGVAHYDFAMSASKELSRDRAAELIELMERAEKPVLIHCQAGADRSGLAAALYVAAIARGGENAAEGQISLRYGHVSLPMTAAYPMDRSFEALEPWLGFPHS
ncbi:MAG TPA: protein tyrosine phosphatase [Rhizobium sp.]|nr:protein tyrosine phosphatase [Rhizobium sp.]